MTPLRPGLLVLLVTFCFIPATRTALALDYVEDAQGLIPPTLDGGRLEVEMGDVDADGHVEIDDYDGVDGTLERIKQIR